MTKKQATLELTFAGALWGFGFVAAVWALKIFTPAEILVYRFIIATILGEAIYLIVKGPRFSSIQDDIKRALPAGFLLSGLLLLQTIGLQYTTATKSGFLTSLYVILVPIIHSFRLPWYTQTKNYLFAFLALVGTVALVQVKFDEFNVGDLWTLGCSIFAAFHIIYIGKISNKVGNSFRFNNFQSLWCLIFLSPLLLTQQKISFYSTDWKAWIGILCLGAASSIIAFYLQIRTQKILSDSTASMLFLLESPFAALFGFLLLEERLNPAQMGGALLILFASILQILSDSSSKTNKETTE